MNRLIEDMITDEEREAVERVLSSLDIRFDRLVILAGLDPKQDFKNSDLRTLNFCGADLRGYDFSGSDLRDVSINANTKIDETTILNDAKIRWIDEGDVPIVQIMMDVKNASGPGARASSLKMLEKHYGKTNHVIQFVVNTASETDNLDCFLDLLDFLPTHLDPVYVKKLAKQGELILRKKFLRSRARTRRDTTKVFSSSSILERLRASEDSLAMSWYRHLAILADDLAQTQALKGTVTEPTEALLFSSLKRLSDEARKTA